MKKIFLAIMIMIGSVAAFAQSNDLATIIKKSNEPLPTEVTDGMTLNGIAQADKNIVFDYTLADDVFDNLKSMEDILREAMVAEIVSSPEPLKKSLVAACKASNLNIVQRFTNSKGATLEIVITPKDMN